MRARAAAKTVILGIGSPYVGGTRSLGPRVVDVAVGCPVCRQRLGTVPRGDRIVYGFEPEPPIVRMLTKPSAAADLAPHGLDVLQYGRPRATGHVARTAARSLDAAAVRPVIVHCPTPACAGRRVELDWDAIRELDWESIDTGTDPA